VGATQRDSPAAACDATDVHFRPCITRTDILVLFAQQTTAIS